ncbi:MAG: phosphoribosylglycinamide formyltransferase [Candidatus Poseidoniaceae archaeon]|nr:phosphoribosylglycinamide formyltransferase [Candidatus Poseidoniaceae archaeon]
MRDISATDPLKLAVFISGSGSGMDALVNHQKINNSIHQTALVVSNKPDVSGIDKAEAHGITTITIELDSSINDLNIRRIEHENRILAELERYNIELVILSGYMRVLSPNFVNKWEGRLINIHPSLLPKYPGAYAHRDALADNARITGCTVHLVDNGVDTGPILAQESLHILDDDDVESLSERVKKLEHKLYPATIDEFVNSLC